MLISRCDYHHAEVFDAGPKRVHGWKRERKLWNILGLSKIVCDDEEDCVSKGVGGAVANTVSLQISLGHIKAE